MVLRRWRVLRALPEATMVLRRWRVLRALLR